MKLPRDISGERLIAHLCRHWNYQVGSRVILSTETPIHHRLPVPRHTPLGIGQFKKVLYEICQAKGIEQADLLRRL